MRKLLPVVAMLFLNCLSGMAQDYTIPLREGKSKSDMKRATFSELENVYTIGTLYGKQIHTKGNQSFVELYFGNGFADGEIGSPKLPVFRNLIQVPFGAEVKVHLKGYSVEEYKLSELGINDPIMPLQESVRKDQNIDELTFAFKPEVYKKQGFIGRDIAAVEVLGTLRSAQIARLEVRPVDYNPVEGIIRVYNDIELEVEFIGGNKEQEDLLRQKTASPYFEAAYSKLMNNFSKKRLCQ